MKNITKKCYYALFDNQIEQVSSIGLNETSKKTVKEHLVNFLLLGNFSEEGEISIKNNTLSELENYYEFKLLKSDVLFPI